MRRKACPAASFESPLRLVAETGRADRDHQLPVRHDARNLDRGSIWIERHRRLQAGQFPSIEQQRTGGIERNMGRQGLGSQQRLEHLRYELAERQTVEMDSAADTGPPGLHPVRAVPGPADRLFFPEQVPADEPVGKLGRDDQRPLRRVADQQRRQNLLRHQRHRRDPQGHDGEIVPAVVHRFGFKIRIRRRSHPPPASSRRNSAAGRSVDRSARIGDCPDRTRPALSAAVIAVYEGCPTPHCSTVAFERQFPPSAKSLPSRGLPKNRCCSKPGQNA